MVKHDETSVVGIEVMRDGQCHYELSDVDVLFSDKPYISAPCGTYRIGDNPFKMDQ